MTEKQKMLLGLVFDANNDAELINERKKCKDLCHEYNMLRPFDTGRQKEIIEELFGRICGSFEINSSFWCDYGYNISIGDNFFANHNCVILDSAAVTFGDNVFIGPNCGFYTAGHPINADERNKGLETAYPITVGNNVWFGGGVQVLPGVTIGDGAVIGAGSVVTKIIPSNAVAFGNPCRVRREAT